jgi:hypothetical protein
MPAQIALTPGAKSANAVRKGRGRRAQRARTPAQIALTPGAKGVNTKRGRRALGYVAAATKLEALFNKTETANQHQRHLTK